MRPGQLWGAWLRPADESAHTMGCREVSAQSFSIFTAAADTQNGGPKATQLRNMTLDLGLGWGSDETVTRAGKMETMSCNSGIFGRKNAYDELVILGGEAPSKMWVA